jgi:methanogen extracellular protein (TIGR04279 family)
MVLLSISPAAASVSDWSFSPQNPVSGDTLTIKGIASPGEKVDIFVNFEKNLPVSGGKFEYVLEDVKIPEGFNNRFTVEATGIKNLNVRVKMIAWITKSSNASGNTATISQSNVPPGTYTVKIDGDAGEDVSQVNLKITAFQGIEADSNGDFSYSYNTKSIPPGDLEISVGGVKKVAILPAEVPNSANMSFFSMKFTDKVVYFLNHTSDPSEGNWITLGSPDDVRRIQLPQPLNITYSGPSSEEYGGVFANLSSDSDGNYTMNFPSDASYSTLPVYLPDDKVNMSFFGDSSLKGKVDIYVLNVTSKSAYGILQAFNTGNIGNLESLFSKNVGGNYTKYSAVLGENGDLLDYNIGSFDPGQYCTVMIQENEDNSLTVISATGFVVAEHDLNVMAPAKIEKGENLDIGMESENTPYSSNYTYGAVLVNEQAYRANIEINSNGTKNGTSLMINGVKVIDKFDINASNYRSKLTKNELQKEIQALIGAGNGSAAIGETGQKNLSLTTFELPEGHYYLFAGAYDPKGRIAGITQSEIEITSLPIQTLPVASFTSSVTSGYAPLSVQFADTSENAIGRTWDFENDGKVDSTDQNPINVYTTRGSYTVNLTVSNANGTDSKLATITVLEPLVGALPKANFSSSVTSGYSPLSVQFTDLSENANGWNWNFGDGGKSTEQNPEHTYSAAGNYIVTLNVSNADGTDLKSATINVQEKAKGPYAYITNYFNNTVSVIDTAANNVVGTVNVGSNPFGVAVSPDGANVYVTNLGSSNVSVIDAATNTVIATVNVGKRPYGIAVSPEGSKVYVTNERSNTVSVIDTATNTVVATLSVGSWPSGVAVSPDGKAVYVVNEDGTVSVIDTATNTVTATVEVGINPIAVAVSPDGTKVYVTNYESNTVSVIDTATNTVTATVEVGSCPGGIAVSPDGSKVFVTNEFSSNVSVIDTATNAVITTVDVGNSLWGVAVSPDGSKAYVANENSSTVSVIDTATNTITATVEVGSGPIAFGKFVGPILEPAPVCNTSIVYGYSFNDLNMDKEKNTEEAGLSGMTINLHGYDTCKGKLVSETTKTNTAGYFEFKGVDPGIYVVTESFVFGWLPTTNAAYTLTVPENSTSMRMDFGNIVFAK